MKTLQELLALKEEADKVVDLENFTGKTIPHEAWTDGVMYKGMNVYKTIYDGGNAEKQIADAMATVVDRFDGKLDMQEVYLGYSPSRDLFIQGYDGWATITDTNYDYDPDDEDSGDEEEEQDHNCSPFIIFRLNDKGSIRIEDSGSDYSNTDNMWYSAGRSGGNGLSGLKRAHKNFSDLIDIRLD